MGRSKSSSKREVYSNTILPQEARRKSQINNVTLHIKELEKEEQTKPKVSRRKEIIKIRVERNEIKTYTMGTSLVAQWLRICLPMQGTRVQSLVLEDLT